jgi:hypothetical protein
MQPQRRLIPVTNGKKAVISQSTRVTVTLHLIAAALHMRKAESIGRPIGDPAFLDRLEHDSGRVFKRAKRGTKPKLSAPSP